MLRILFGLLVFCFTLDGLAHEQWMLTEFEIHTLNQNPHPFIFAHISTLNSVLVGLALLFFITWIYIGHHLSQYFLYGVRKKLDQLSMVSHFMLRLGLAAMLVITSLGLIPRVGNALHTPTLFAPDLVLHGQWQILKWLELGLGCLLLLGLRLKEVGIFLLGLMMLACYLYHLRFLPYLPFYLGATLFLMTQAPGRFMLSIPQSLCLLRICTGIGFIISSIQFKFLQPNLIVSLLDKHALFTFGIPHDVFGFCMAITELLFGLLLVLGSMTRIAAGILLVLFLTVSIITQENILMHSVILGILIVLLFEGGGRMQNYPELIFEV